MTNLDIIRNKIFVGTSKRLSRNYLNILTDEDKNILMHAYSEASCIEEAIIWLKYNKVALYYCKTCGKRLPFKSFSKPYGEFCSKECMYASPEIIQRRKQTSLKQHGSETYNNPEKNKQTCLEKYGVENFFQSDDFKIKATKTCLEKYGVENAAQNKDIINKRVASTNYKEIVKKTKRTVRNKYGVNTVLQLPLIRELRKSEESKIREYVTKRKNGTFNSSSVEERSYQILLEKYPDVKRQYKSDVYPFNCDFYIPSLDLYIECNYHWTHGGHPYNPNNEDDIDKLNIWKTKNSKFYNIGINTWTIRDVNKRSIAKQNNLNYLEVWNLNELYAFTNN